MLITLKGQARSVPESCPECLPFEWKTPKYRGEFQWNCSSQWKFPGKKVIPFEVLPFSRFY